MAEETTKIVRMQQRRGLKQDLPKPLRPGEIGFATDSRQLFIGADTTDATSAEYNKTGVFEKTGSAQSTTSSFANVQMVKFTVPHKVFDRGDFNGVTDSKVWTPSSNVASSSTSTQYSRLGTVFLSSDSYYRNRIDGNEFTSSDVTVVKNGVVLVPSETATIGSGEDYFFNQSGNISLGTHNHSLTFRTPPSGADQISISYYSNSDIISAISASKIGTSSVDGFYNYAGLTDNTSRHLSNTNIRVSAGTGVGFIGLQFKHIQVATDVKTYPSEISSGSLTLGNLLLSKTDDAVSSSMTAVNSGGASGTITLDNITSGSYNVAGLYSHVYVSGASDWVNGKVLRVKTYNSNASTITAEIPANSASVTRNITSLSNVSGNLILNVSNVENIQIGDTLRFLDVSSNANVTLNNVEGSVTSVSSNDVTISGYGSLSNSNVSNVTFITLKGGSNTSIVVTSTSHGLSDGANVITTDSTPAITSGNTTVSTTAGNNNTFILNTTSNVATNITPLTFTPVISNASVSSTPVLTIDLSAATDIDTAKNTVNNLDTWPQLNNIPSISNRLYITHAEAVQKTPFNFRIFDDSLQTVSTLGLTPDLYTRGTSTVKAKLENWIASIVADSTVNLFKEVYVNQEFSSSGPNFTTWNLKIDSTNNEMDFESRFEARDFTSILNNLYYESVNPDIKGLMNIKTNIEFLTTEALAAGSAISSFPAPESVTLASGVNIITELGISDLTAYDTYVVEYSIKDSYSNSSLGYRRVGTLIYGGDKDSNTALINDTYTDSTSNVTGGVSFTATVGSGALSLRSNNTLSPVNDVTMKYIVRRWVNP